MDCLDCDRIGLSGFKGIMWCKDGQWRLENGEEHIFILSTPERRSLLDPEIKDVEMRYRKIFLQGGPKCKCFCDPSRERV